MVWEAPPWCLYPSEEVTSRPQSSGRTALAHGPSGDFLRTKASVLQVTRFPVSPVGSRILACLHLQPQVGPSSACTDQDWGGDAVGTIRGPLGLFPGSCALSACCLVTSHSLCLCGLSALSPLLRKNAGPAQVSPPIIGVVARLSLFPVFRRFRCCVNLVLVTPSFRSTYAEDNSHARKDSQTRFCGRWTSQAPNVPDERVLSGFLCVAAEITRRRRSRCGITVRARWSRNRRSRL